MKLCNEAKNNNSTEKEALLEMLQPQQSLGTNATIERVVQSLWLDNQGYVFMLLMMCVVKVLQSRFES